jgi:hypothetical protein
MLSHRRSIAIAVLQPELYRIRDAAAVLAVSPRTVHTLIEKGVLLSVGCPERAGNARPSESRAPIW